MQVADARVLLSERGDAFVDEKDRTRFAAFSPIGVECAVEPSELSRPVAVAAILANNHPVVNPLRAIAIDVDEYRHDFDRRFYAFFALHLLIAALGAKSRL